MINKQNLWFLTLFSLILILGVYYVTLPNELLDKISIKDTKQEVAVVEEIKEENQLTSLRVSLEEERQEALEVLKEQLTKETITVEEKNNIYSELKYLNEVQGKEENLEKKIKKEFDLDCFIKIDNKNISLVCISSKHDIELANKIMRSIQSNYDERMYISISFQKKHT
ncbi:MAG: SpoIIIAH-like family protein [Bacilli bacterium]|nr:SpoIIIAH-like family protein [Bacilli bacterium]